MVDVILAPDGLPSPQVTLVERLTSANTTERDPLPATFSISDLPAATVPGHAGTPPAGRYLVPLVKSGDLATVANIPSTPGTSGSTRFPLPRIYPWDATLEAHLANLGIQAAK